MSARTPRLASLRQRRPGTIAFEAPWKGPRRTEGYYSQLSAPRWRSAGHCLRLHLDLGLRCVVPSGERSYRRLSRHMDDLVAFRFNSEREVGRLWCGGLYADGTSAPE